MLTQEQVRKVVIDEDDFAHEMQVSAALNEASKIEFSHGGTYSDPITAKPRQFDFQVLRSAKDCQLVLTIECKNLSLSSPIVVSGRPRRENEAYHELVHSRFGTFRVKHGVVDGLSSVTERATMTDSEYPPDEFTGKSLLRVKLTGKSATSIPDADVYDKWAQALASASRLISASADLAKHLVQPHCYSGFVPLVVVPDGSLWKCAYDHSGRMLSDPEPASDVPFYVGHRYQIGHGRLQHPFRVSHLHFCTVSGLKQRLIDLANDQGSWFRMLSRRPREEA